MKLRDAVLLFVLAPACATPFSAAAAAKLWERAWLEIKTEHFVISSALPEQQSVALAVELEHFRVVARLLIMRAVADAFEERIPTKVYLLPYAAPDLGIDAGIAGYFEPGERANYAVMRASGDDSDEVLKHEYVHFLVHNHGSQLYPPWFDEGFAEVLSTLTVRNGVIEYGKPMHWRLDTLSAGPWMSFSKLLQSRDPSSLGLGRAFYNAQSWLLMHYLMIGRAGHSFSTEATDFLRRSEAGEPAPAAFEAAFGIDPGSLAGTLAVYGERLRYYRSVGVFPLPEVNPQVRRLAVDEVAAGLGLLALIHGSYAASEKYYAAALAANPNNGVGLAGMGDIHKHAKRFAEAERCYAQAVAAEPGNGNHELDWGEYFLQRAEDEADAAQRRALLVEARRHFARSYAINPQNPETLDQNGRTYLFDGEDAAKGVESLEVAHELLPSQPDIQRDLAVAYIKGGRQESAREILTRLVAWSDAKSIDGIRKLLAELASSQPSAESDAGGGPTKH